MKKILLITFSSLKKKKANAIVLLFLVALAVMLLHVSISALSYTKTLTKDKIEKAKSPDIMVVATNSKSVLESKLSNVEGYKEHEFDEGFIISDAIITNKKKQETMMSFFLNYDEPKTIGIPYFIEEGKEKKDNSIIIPYYLHVTENYKIGDVITVNSSSGSFVYEIYGYTEDIYYSNPTNITSYKFWLFDEGFKDMKEKAAIQGSTIVSVDVCKINTSIDSGVFENELAEIYTADMYLFASMDVSVMSTGCTIFVTILMAIILLFAVIIITVCLVVIKFTISSHIESNIKNLGALSSIGYTSKQLRISTCLEFLLISVAGGILGLILSLTFNGFVANQLSSACGLKWELPYNAAYAAITYFGVIFFISVISYLSSRKCKVISPLAALRNGLENHNFKKNKLPLAKTKMGLNANLGLKSLLANTRQNIGILIIVSLLSFTCITALIIGSNFSDAKGPILNVVGIEVPNISAMKTEDCTVDLEQLYKEIASDEDVRMTNYEAAANYNIISQTADIHVTVRAFRDNTLLESKTLYKGNEALRDNEVVLSNVVANILDVKIGDIIYVESDTNKEEFYVVGIMQHMNNMGKGARLTEEGMMRLNSNFDPLSSTFNIYLKDDVNPNDYINELTSKYSNMGVTFVNVDELAKTTIATISDTFNIITAMLLVVTGIIITLITVLIIKMKLLKEKRMMGIYKALGFTSNNLMYQTIISFVPVVLIGSVLGAVISYLSTNKIFAFCLSSSGIKTASIAIHPTFIIFGILIISLLSLIITLFYSLRIKKIEPYQMIIEM